MNTTQRILSRWRDNGHETRHQANQLVRTVRRGNTLTGGSMSPSIATYGASGMDDNSSDFLGDWRALNSWQQFDLLLVRNRSRQVERYNPWAIAFKRNMLNNTFGAMGFHFESLIETGTRYGDATNGVEDETTNGIVNNFYSEMGMAKNLTTRQKLSRRDLDRLLLSRLIFDGECILRKIRGYPANGFNFSWQPINPDYLDHNLNRLEPNGNVIRMGVELDGTFKFPVAYWFWRSRPNDRLYNYTFDNDLYVRVPAEEVIHFYLQTEDEEQVRGWPWIFAAVITLFRMGKFEEAALVNAAIGASRGVYFKKTYPDGFVEAGGLAGGSTVHDDGSISLDLPQGSALELPYGVEPVVADMRYPDAEFEPFRNAMMLSAGAVFGTSYATTTGDLSKANFVSSRMGQLEEREQYMAVQEFFIEKWKRPGFDEELYRAMLAQKVALPLSKFEKFNKPDFTGRRWKFVQPVDDMKANEMKLNNLTTSIGDIIRETTQENPRVVFKRIAKEAKLLKDLGLERVTTAKSEAGKSTSEDIMLDENGQPMLDENGQPMKTTSGAGSPMAEQLKRETDAYGVAVRAGALTPQSADEEYFRTKAGLPKLSAQGKAAWEKDKGVRRPITLTQPDGSHPAATVPETTPAPAKK
ncbi:MAG: hypothetical protein QOE26_2747 [Verrucomicrobiota bacterium]|jgi:lambda family phage portal protein